MIRYITSAILISAAVGMFLILIDPLFNEVKTTQANIGRLDQVLQDSRRIQAIRDEILGEFNAIPEGIITRLEKMVPDNVDNVRLILEINRIAAQFGLVLQDVAVSEATPADTGVLGPTERPYGVLELGLTLTGPYNAFRDFIESFERNLRIVDVAALSFTASDRDFNRYLVNVRTYWLK